MELSGLIRIRPFPDRRFTQRDMVCPNLPAALIVMYIKQTWYPPMQELLDRKTWYSFWAPCGAYVKCPNSPYTQRSSLQIGYTVVCLFQLQPFDARILWLEAFHHVIDA